MKAMRAGWRPKSVGEMIWEVATKKESGQTQELGIQKGPRNPNSE